MTYNLEEFRTWLEEKPERKENLPNWTSFYRQERLNTLISLIDVPVNNQPFNYSSHQPYQQVIKQWKEEVDARERERERERAREVTLVC